MKAAVAGIGAAVAASACCIGPVVFTLIGAGAIGASAVALEPYRPWLIGMVLVLVAVSFYDAYRPVSARDDCADRACAPASRRTAQVLTWIAALVAAALIAFPYYVGWFI